MPQAAQSEQSYEEPRIVVNLNKLIQVEQKKDLKFEVHEQKKTLLSNKEKYTFKANTPEDFKIWVSAISGEE